jgi:two-component system sensor kinase FixL
MSEQMTRLGASLQSWAPHPRAAGARRYLAAVLLIAAAVLLRQFFQPWLGPHAPYLQFFLAILLAAWYGGFGPGVLATMMAALAAMYLYLPPAGFAIGGPADAIALAFFIGTGLAVAGLNDRLRKAEQALRLEANLATARAERLDAIINTSSELGERLRASEARWRAVIDSAVDGIIVIDVHGRIESFNPGAERLFGYSEHEALGRNVNMLMPSPYREEHDTYMSRYLTTGRAKIIGIGREVTGLRKDGTTFPVHLSVGEITVGGERKFTGILHDLSARVRMEEQIREQTSLAKLGEMSAVIAHEVKNPLAGIRGAIQVFASRMPKEGAEASILTEIVNRIDSLDRLMKELLLFARPPKPNRASVQLVPLVSATADLLSQDPSLQELEVEITGSAPPIAADPEMLKIVFHNLLINAAHAMQGRGRLQVDVNAIDSSCQIAISDSGPGIPADVREKIFTPFFTTKARGTGLGLPTARRFVDAHNGQIVIDCPPSGGTRVVVRLPIDT